MKLKLSAKTRNKHQQQILHHAQYSVNIFEKKNPKTKVLQYWTFEHDKANMHLNTMKLKKNCFYDVPLLKNQNDQTLIFKWEIAHLFVFVCLFVCLFVVIVLLNKHFLLFLINIFSYIIQLKYLK